MIKVVKTIELTSGMVTAAPIYSGNGQLVVGSDVMLTPQLINHLKFYGVEEASIQDHHSGEVHADTGKSNLISYQDRIRSTVEFKHFKKEFLKSIRFLRSHIDDIANLKDKQEEEALLSEILSLFHEMDGESHMLEMLHCIRGIDTSTYAHCLNVAILCRLMGRWLHYSKEDVDALTLSGLFHDIGKSRIPKSVLMKPEKLTAEEYSVMKKHSLYGYDMLKPLSLDARIKRVALMHHERSDGSGYPLGLQTEDIDPFSIIVSIADVYDAMTTDRVYREAICPFEVIATFEKEGFSKYNTQYTTIFLSHIVDTYMNYHVRLSDGSLGQIVLKNKKDLARPTLYLSSKEYLDLSAHPELYIKEII